MIVHAARFVAAERPYWNELQAALERLQREPGLRLTVEQVERLHYLYERCAAALARLDRFSDPQVRAYLEALVARAYSEIHESRTRGGVGDWRAWLVAFPQAFRRHARAFALAAGITLAGCALGSFALLSDPQAKAVLMPFPGLMEAPAQRVAREEQAKQDWLGEVKASFSANLMTHNIRVTFLTIASGLTWGVGTVVLLFYNGVVLGAVVADYLMAGQSEFLLGWLLPHGAVEIPAILFGGQAGLVLASALIGRGDRLRLADRLRAAGPDLVALSGGAVVLLVWAGAVEAFVSQYHQPVLPYGLKIGLGLAESAALCLYLARAGRR